MTLPVVHEKLSTTLTMYHRTFHLRLDFRTVLNVIDIFQDPILEEMEKLTIGLQALIKMPSRLQLIGLTADKRAEILNVIVAEYISEGQNFAPPEQQKPEEEKPVGIEKSLDIAFDAERIYAAFLQSYQIDLQTSRLDWRLFRVLLGNIPAGTRLAEIVDIRLRPLPPPNKHNAKERQALIKAKAAVAIKYTEEEAQANFSAAVDKLADKLVSMIPKEGGG